MDYISEAEALSEIYDGFEGGFEPYSKSDRRDYVDAKSRRKEKYQSSCRREKNGSAGNSTGVV